MSDPQEPKQQPSFYSHGNAEKLENLVVQTQKRLQLSKDLALPLEETLSLLNQLIEFPFGRFLFENKGGNGYWTRYYILMENPEELSHPLEKWMITQAPALASTRERYRLFRQLTQARVKSNMTLASVPCGLMDDLLSLDYSDVENVTLMGFDLDPESLDQASKNSQNYLSCHRTRIEYHLKDALHLGADNQIDLFTSNGLNFYIDDDRQVIALYRSFYQALKPGGILIISAYAPSPNDSPESSWRQVDRTVELKQRALFTDIIGAKWQHFRTEQTMRKHLEEAGFHILEVHNGSSGVMPTYVAEKSG